MIRNLPLGVMPAEVTKKLTKAMQDPYIKSFINSISIGIDSSVSKGKTQYITTDIFHLGEYEVMAIE